MIIDINQEPELFWLPKVNGELGLFARQIGNLMPYVNVKLANLPLYHIPNEHVVEMQLQIGGGGLSEPGNNTLSLTLIDPTNFILERSFRYAMEKNKGGAWASLLLQFGWTDGVNKYGPLQGNRFLKFTVNSWVQTIEAMVSRWTITGTTSSKFLLKKVRVPDTLTTAGIIENVKKASDGIIDEYASNIIKELIQKLIPTMPVQVQLVGKVDVSSLSAMGGFVNQVGDLKGFEMLHKLLTRVLKTTDGRYFQYCFKSDVFENIQPDSTIISNPVNTAIDIFIFDSNLLEESRIQFVSGINQAMIGGDASLSDFLKCSALIKWPNNLGYIKQFQIGGNTNWIGHSFQLTQTRIDESGEVVQTSEQSGVNPNPAILDAPERSEIEESYSAENMSKAANSETPSQIVSAKAKDATSYANQLNLTCQGEPWFINQASFIGLFFGVIFDYKTNLFRSIKPYYHDDPTSLKQSIPILSGLPEDDLNKIASEGFFNPDKYISPITGTWKLFAVSHSIQGSIFTTQFSLKRSKIPDENSSKQ